MKTVFVVDDNAIDLRIIQLTLIKYPVFKHVLYFQSGQSIAEYLFAHREDAEKLPDILLLDLHMPQFDGWCVLEVLEKLQSSLAKRITVYVLSASINASDVQRAKTYDFLKDFISKPVTLEHLDAIAELKFIK